MIIMLKIEPEEAPEKNKDLNQDIAEATNEFNEGKLIRRRSI